jgi:L-fucose isomerase-like protein
MFRDEDSYHMRNRTLNTLSTMKGVKVVVPSEELTTKGLVRNDEDAEKTIELLKNEKIDGLVIGAMNFGDEVSAVSVASSFSKHPKMVFAVKEEPEVMGEARRDSFCGTLSITSGLYRRKIPFLFAGVLIPEEHRFKNAVSGFIRVCSIFQGFRGANIGLVGPRPERFETCTFNEIALIRKFRQRVVPTSSADIFQAANSLKDDDPELKKITQEISEKADTSGLREGVLPKIARLECALVRFSRENHLAGMGVRCWPTTFMAFGIEPCFILGRLTDQGVMSACEADMYGALSMLLQYLAVLKSSVPHFIDWTAQHPKHENLFLAWHCGNAPPSLACKGCKVQVAGGGQGAFSLKKGAVTICRLQEYDNKFKLLVTKGEVVEAEPVPQTGSWVKVDNLGRLYTVLAEEGFVHHASMIHGDYTQILLDACKFLGIKPLIV